MVAKLVLLALSVSTQVSNILSVRSGVGGIRGNYERERDTTDKFLLCYFIHNGQDGLHIALSDDGFKFDTIPGDHSFFKPEAIGEQQLFRDPSIVQTPDRTFHLVWTTGWTDRTIGYATSKNLVNWENARALAVFGKDVRVRNVWAPDISYNSTSNRLVVVWSSTLTGQFSETMASSENGLNHRLYYTSWDPGNLDNTIQPAAVFFDPGFNVIDGNLLQIGERQVLFFKDERRWPPMKTLHMARSSIEYPGPTDWKSGPPLIAGPFWAEGPSAILVNSNQSALVYFEKYAEVKSSGDDEENIAWINQWGVVFVKDVAKLQKSTGSDIHWIDLSKRLKMPPGARHGQIIRITHQAAEEVTKAAAIEVTLRKTEELEL
ncbi:hypothetical protein CYMTET_52421 [Cymbomonas tetramitiformis]|uniref:Glycosyl hydrolase n=1 Tax=Cymbomonas tetramitiformis TaxID=36881 RepID=A0AAE0BJ28_9CHLO|nr:hypothetical protein CYMTET_52421 [Cymbomonas tetramitiformis]